MNVKNSYRFGKKIDLTPNLVSYYKCDDVFTGTNDTILDSWGSNDGICVASAESGTDGQVNNCMFLNSGSDNAYIDTSSGDFDFGGVSDSSFSASIWNKITTWDSGGNYLLNRRTSSTLRDWQFVIEKDNGAYGDNIYILLSDGTNWIKTLVQVNEVDYEGGWHHYLFTYDGNELVSGLKVYVDGVLLTQVHVTSGVYAGMTNIPTKIQIGKRGWQNGTPIDKVDEIKFWDKELTQEEITQDYDNGVSGIPLI